MQQTQITERKSLRATNSETNLEVNKMPTSSRQAVFTPNAPGPYPALSQAVIHNGLVFTAGSLGTNPVTKKLVEGTIADRTVSSCPLMVLNSSNC